MITPAFELTQNEEFLIASIQVPYAKVSEVEIHFEDNDFMFYSKPYYLRLNLPGKVHYAEEPLIKYDFDKRIFTVHAQKQQKGEVFDGLDLVTFLLAPKKGKTVSTPKIEILESSNDNDGNDEEEFDWTIEQLPSEDQLGNLPLFGQQCGFANTYSFSVFNLKDEAAEIFDVHEPENKLLPLRREERMKAESDHFNEDHYIADLYEDDEIQESLKYRPEWESLFDEFQRDASTLPDGKIVFTPEEREQLRKLPNKEYLLDKTQVKTSYLGLLDILFSYAYNKRTTEGENTVESGWTINKLSATLSWLEVFSSISEVAHTCIRRSLCYPLYRHFELSVTVLEDVRKILLLGRKYVIKCLLEIHTLFCQSEPRYILNDLFITDYCIWMQTKKCSSNKLVPLADAIGKILLTKGDIGLNLVDVESFAQVAWMSQEVSAKKDRRPSSEITSSHPQESKEDTSLCSKLEGLSLVKNTAERERLNSDSTDSYSEFEVCSSCTSDSSSECSSSTFDTSSSLDSDDIRLSDSD